MNLQLKIFLLRRLRLRRRNNLTVTRRNLRDSQNPFEISENQFMEMYKFPKDLCVRFLNKIKSRFFATERISGIPVNIRFLAALRFYAKGGHQRRVGEDVMSTLSQTSMSRSIQEVTNILNEICNQYVYFPGQDEQNEIQQDFYKISSFPGVVGIVGGSHIKIGNSSTENYSRISSNAVNLLVICDPKYVIRYANAKFMGTADDAYIWLHSTIHEFLESKYSQEERDFWILGSTKFPLQPWLMTPFNSPANEAEEKYNCGHRKAHLLVKQCLDILRSRFRCLSTNGILSYDATKAGKIINACIVLHNLLMKANVPLPDTSSETDVLTEESPECFVELDDNTLLEGLRVRQEIVTNYFNV